MKTYYKMYYSDLPREGRAPTIDVLQFESRQEAYSMYKMYKERGYTNMKLIKITEETIETL
jgi:hypothetical protein